MIVYDSKSFTDIIDEIRFSNILRSHGWNSTEYTNQINPRSFYTIGPEESEK
jgi:hypothetical protein